MAITSYSDQELQRIVQKFDIAERTYAFQTLTSGLINDTFLVSIADRPMYVLQRINDSVFKNVPGLIANLECALPHLDSDTYTQLHLYNTKEGRGFYTTHQEPEKYWRLVGYIEHTRTFDTAPNTTVAFEAGRIIGSFHSLLEKSNTDDYADTIPRFHDLSYRKDQFLSALKTTEGGKIKMAQPAISFAEQTIGRLNEMPLSELPMRVCHNDTKLNNILFSQKTDKALCLIDLDTLMAGHFLYDFGDAVRTIVNTAPEDEKDHSKITFEKPLFEAFVKGLANNDAFLSEKELHSLPSGAILMPFLHGLRALTDYLDNNRYYKVKYENQNLDRAESLFRVTQRSIEELDYMQKAVKGLLTATSS